MAPVGRRSSLDGSGACRLGCDAVHVKEYGVVEAEGAQGHQQARICLRAPRVAVRFESSHHWQSMFALAMWMAAGWWGGYGFIYLPRGTGELHPVLAGILGAYDPDYLLDALWTHGDIEALEPGWHARRYEGWPADPGESAAFIGQQAYAEQVVHQGLGEDIGANLCSPYHENFEEEGRFRSMHALSPPDERDGHSLASVLGGNARADFEIPDGLDPLLTLALGMRAGYPAKPPLPLGRAVDGVTERLPQRYVSHALSSRQDRPGLALRGLTTAWDLTQIGLVKIGKGGPAPRPVAVIGSAAEDLALALALDRMRGPTAWVPAEWVQNTDLRWLLQESYRDLIHAARLSGHPPIVTSISLSEQQLNDVVRATWAETGLTWQGSAARPRGDVPEVMSADRLELGTATYLACAPGDYDVPFTSPTSSDGRDGFEFLLPIPVHTPSSEHLRGPQRPFWVVDVEVYPQRMQAGRNLGGRRVLADDDAFPSTILRSGRDGVSFNPMNMLFVPGGATLQQSITKPRLHVLGLRGWIEVLTAQDQPGTDVVLSQAAAGR